ncbi:TRAP transporter small permease [Thalassotalea litorea]|uniref:TRAP transporter small permease n=1 Tax=Thalassotalea litorea TaxID=2020715 RepID=UPI003736BACD
MTDYKKSNNSAAENADSSTTLSFHQDDEPVFDYANFRFEDWIAFALFWLLAITVFSQFISRFIFAAPLGWTEEVARYQLICLGFMGACIGIRKNSHIFVALFHRWLPAKVSIRLYQIIATLNVLLIATLAYFAAQIMPQLHIHKMASLDVPISVLYGIVLASLLIMLGRSIQLLLNLLKQPNQLLEQSPSCNQD